MRTRISSLILLSVYKLLLVIWLEYYEKNKITAHKKRLTMTAESEPVREPTDHRCERCGKVFAKAEELTNHYEGEHAEWIGFITRVIFDINEYFILIFIFKRYCTLKSEKLSSGVLLRITKCTILALIATSTPYGAFSTTITSKGFKSIICSAFWFGEGCGLPSSISSPAITTSKFFYPIFLSRMASIFI